MSKQIKIWDSFVRYYHWLQVALIVALYLTADFHELSWHFACAYLLISLFIVRIIWGFIGSDTARFSHFITSPKVAIAYAKENLNFKRKIPKSKPQIGHNPAGGYMVLALFILIAMQLITGLFAHNHNTNEGPFAHLVSHNASSLLTNIHKTGQGVLIAAIVLHLIAIIFYRMIKKQDLIKPMLTGFASIDATQPKLRNSMIAWLLVIVLFAVICFFWGHIYTYLFSSLWH